MTIGDGTVTTYTFGQDLYDDMLAAIASAEQRILFESYIWKADDTGEVFKQASAARRDAESRSTRSTTASRTSWCRRCSSGSARV